MADIDEYSSYLDKRNNAKRIKLELEQMKERKAQENKKKSEQWKNEYNNCSSPNEYRQYVTKHNGDTNNPYLQQAKSKCRIEESIPTQSTPIQHTEDDRDKVIIKIIAAVFVCLIGFGIMSGFKSPERKPFPPSGYSYCIVCHGTGYEYHYFWGCVSKLCSPCLGSGYRQNQTSPSSIVSPSSINAPTFKGKKTDEEWFNYYIKKANEATNNEKWHYDRAEKASANGDEKAAKDHIERARSYHSDAENYMRSAEIYKK